MSLKLNLLKRFSSILPTPEQTQLLSACLWTGEEGRRAWASWRECVEDPIKAISQDSKGLKRLLPLLLNALERNGVPVDKYLRTCLRTAYVREELRSKTYRQICRDVLSVFRSSKVRAIVLKGAALAETVYVEPVHRHCHDIDILLEESELCRVSSLLSPLGFTMLSKRAGSEGGDIKFEHKSGLPLELHRRLFRIPDHDVPFAELWTRSKGQIIAGVKTPILSPADNLMQVCVNASYSEGRASLGWVCDGCLIINGHPDLNWDVLLKCAQCCRIELPLSLTLGYLAEELKAPIPSTFLDSLNATVLRTGIEPL